MGPPNVLRFVTGNAGKVRDLQAQLQPLGWTVLQAPVGYPEIQADSLAEVAEAGASHLLATGIEPPFILEDAGLFVDSLAGFPGVYSRHCMDTIGCEGILALLAGRAGAERSARFAACIAYVDEAQEIHLFDGECLGSIAEDAVGEGGFGFDPIFTPTGEEQTFGQMSGAEKARFSHRAKAVFALLSYLEQTTKR